MLQKNVNNLKIIQDNDVRLKIILQPREDKRMNPLSREGF